MGKAADEEGHFHHVVRVATISFLKGTSPLVAIEFARRAVPGHVRPSFQELENACKGKGAPAAAPEAAGTPATPEAPAAPAAA
jgi:chemotaxis protein MotA